MAEKFESVRTRGNKGNKTTMLERSLMAAQGMKTSANIKSSFAVFLAGVLKALREYVVGRIDAAGTMVRDLEHHLFSLLTQHLRTSGLRYGIFKSIGSLLWIFWILLSLTPR